MLLSAAFLVLTVYPVYVFTGYTLWIADPEFLKPINSAPRFSRELFFACIEQIQVDADTLEQREHQRAEAFIISGFILQCSPTSSIFSIFVASLEGNCWNQYSEQFSPQVDPSVEVYDKGIKF